MPRTSKGQFSKGVSGNPGGRPKADATLRDLARSHTADAIGTLLAIMRSKKAPAAARVSAAVAVLDRGHGKPAYVLQHEGEIVMRKQQSTIDTARRLIFQAEEIARQIEKTRPDLGKVDRKDIVRRMMDEILNRPKPGAAGK